MTAAPSILTVETPSLGDRSYLVHDGSVAFVVDPQRDFDRVLALAEQAGVRITDVFETHMHNDYVTGGLALAEQTGATYHVNAKDPVAFERHPVSDGDVVEVGASMQVRVLATPGHTYTHLAFALESGGAAIAVFTGGSLLYGSTGRPDLLGPDHTDALVRHQYASAHRLASELPEQTEIFPTHGFGSFCSATQSDGTTTSTIGQEKRTNPALTADEQTYVDSLLAGLDVWPAYYATMGSSNEAGPAAPDLTAPQQADPAELRRRIEAGEWVVDLRNRTAFAAGHVAGTLNFGLDGPFATYLGWVIPFGTPLTLLGETPEQVAEAQRELVRIGIDRLEAAATGKPEDWAGSEPLKSAKAATFADLAAVRRERPVTVVDVRRKLEWNEGHVEGAIHLPIHDLVSRIGEVPAGGQVWVHCAAGYRAAAAASLLEAAGHDVVAVDEEFTKARESGLDIVTESQDALV